MGHRAVGQGVWWLRGEDFCYQLECSVLFIAFGSEMTLLIILQLLQIPCILFSSFFKIPLPQGPYMDLQTGVLDAGWLARDVNAPYGRKCDYCSSHPGKKKLICTNPAPSCWAHLRPRQPRGREVGGSNMLDGCNLLYKILGPSDDHNTLYSSSLILKVL